MKKIASTILLTIALLFSACLREHVDNQSNAALELYCQYASNDNLTVAYLCDFMVEQHAINAVMIQADDDESWSWLQDEFDVSQHDNNYAIEMGMEFRDTTAMRRILHAVANKLSKGGLTYKDTIVEVDASVTRNASKHGQDGYVTAVDDSNHTLWIFYYDNAEECSSIMTHIRKDIFTY